MAYTIGVYNRKGGVGKTHAAINLGACMALSGKRVLLIDGDSQCNLSMFFFGEEETIYDGALIREDEIMTIYNVLHDDDNIYNAIISKKYSVRRKILNKFQMLECNIDILPGSKRTDELEIQSADLLAKHLDLIQNEYDFILIDFPPASSDLTIVHMAACDFIIVPAELGDETGISGYFDVMTAVETVTQSGTNPALNILGLFYTRAMDYKEDQKNYYTDSLRNKDELNLFKTYIHFDYKASREAGRLHQPLCVCFPRSKSTKDYMALMDEIYKKLKIKKSK